MRTKTANLKLLLEKKKRLIKEAKKIQTALFKYQRNGEMPTLPPRMEQKYKRFRIIVGEVTAINDKIEKTKKKTKQTTRRRKK